MMKTKRLPAILMLLQTLFFYIPCSSQTLPNGQQLEYNPVLTAVPFLTITPDARHSAMGDAGAATTADANAQYWNGAKGIFAESTYGVSFSYAPWLTQLVKGINLSCLSGYYKLNANEVIGSSLRYFAIGDVQITDHTGTTERTVSPNEFAFDIGYSRRLSEKWSGGVSMRYIRSDLSSGSSDYKSKAGNGFASDISFYYRKDWVGKNNQESYRTFGIQVSNIGTKISYDNGRHEGFIPANLRIGTGFGRKLAENHSVLFAIDINKLLVPTPRRVAGSNDNDEIVMVTDSHSNQSSLEGIFSSFGDAPGGFGEELKEITAGLGAEYSFKEQFMLRGGYFYEHPYKGNRNYFSAGIGVKFNAFGLDLSYLVPNGGANNAMSNTFHFTLTFCNNLTFKK